MCIRDSFPGSHSTLDIIKTTRTTGEIVVAVEPTSNSTDQAAGIVFFDQSKRVTSITVTNFAPGSPASGLQTTAFEIFGIPLCDTDKDGIANHLDLDSDRDGCYDSFEAGVIGATADGSATDSLTAGPFGANGFADVLETSEDGVYTGTYDYSIAINSLQNQCLDNDMDGVPDYADLDDDNDGILDSLECPFNPIDFIDVLANPFGSFSNFGSSTTTVVGGGLIGQTLSLIHI